MKNLTNNKKELYFSSLKSQILEILTRSGLKLKVGENRFFPTLDTALNEILNKLNTDDQHLDKENCPLEKYIENDSSSTILDLENNKKIPIYKKAFLRVKTIYPQ